MGFLKNAAKFTPFGVINGALSKEAGSARPGQAKAIDKQLKALRNNENGVGDMQRRQAIGQGLTAGQRSVSGDINGGIGNRLLQRGNVDPALNAATAASIVSQQGENNLQAQRIAEYNDQIAANNAAKQKKLAIIQGAAQAGAALASDVTIKKDIQDITDFTKNALRYLTPYQFHYSKDVGMDGDVIGIMAQDLEKSDAGKTLLTEQDGHMAIDMKRAVSFILASLADINSRLEKAGV